MPDTERPETDTVELLAGAGTALARSAWGDARELYERALGVEESAEALEGLAVASWWDVRPDAPARRALEDFCRPPGVVLPERVTEVERLAARQSTAA